LENETEQSITNSEFGALSPFQRIVLHYFCYIKLHGAMKNICCRLRWYFWKGISECLLDRRRQDNIAAG